MILYDFDKRDPLQWQRRYAWFPCLLGGEIIWLEPFEDRCVFDGNRCSIYRRRIGEQGAGIESVRLA